MKEKLESKADKMFNEYGLTKKDYAFGIDYFNKERDILVHFNYENKSFVAETYYNKARRWNYEDYQKNPNLDILDYHEIMPDEELQEIISLKLKELGWLDD